METKMVSRENLSFFCDTCDKLIPFENEVSEEEMLQHIEKAHPHLDAVDIRFDPDDPFRCAILEIPAYSDVKDMVDHPDHYQKGNGLECIDWINMMLDNDEYRGYLKGNILKYVWRHEAKGKPKEDLEKAKKYLDFLIEDYKKEEAE